MPAVTRKNISRLLHRPLKTRAAINHRSLNREILATLEAGATPRIRPVEEWLQETANLRSRLKFKTTDKELNRHKRVGRA